jgi:hypothetical protein
MTPRAMPCSTVPPPDCGTVKQPQRATRRESPGAARPPGFLNRPGRCLPPPVSRFACLGMKRWNKPFDVPPRSQVREVR